MKFTARLLVIFLLIVALFVSASAHEGREVGKYVINFGWRNEPAYTTLLNGPELTVVTHDDETPVEGLTDTLKIEVAYGGKTKVLRLRAVFGSPGHYTADLIPTQPGDYSFHLTGTIGDVTVDEVFDSAEGEFNSVDPISDIQFP